MASHGIGWVRAFFCTSVTALLASSITPACNSLTGVGDLTFDLPASAGGSAGTTGAGGGAAGGAQAGGAQGGNGQGGGPPACNVSAGTIRLPSCDTCTQQNCCAEFNACKDSFECQKCLAKPETCPLDKLKVKEFSDLVVCWNTNCGGRCVATDEAKGCTQNGAATFDACLSCCSGLSDLSMTYINAVKVCAATTCKDPCFAAVGSFGSRQCIDCLSNKCKTQNLQQCFSDASCTSTYLCVDECDRRAM